MKIIHKLFLIIAGLMIFLSTVLTYNIIIHEKREMRKELEKRGISLAENLSYNSEYSVLINDQAGLNTLIDGVLRDEDVNYVIILDAQGEIISSKGGKFLNKARKGTFIQTALEYDRTIAQEIPDTEIINISSPIWTTSDSSEDLFFIEDTKNLKRIGTIQVGISLQRQKDLIRGITNRIILINIIILTISFLTSFLFLRFVTAPIKNLMKATKSIADGNFDLRIDVSRHDELGQLSQSFNDMAESLCKKEKELLKANKEIESWNRELENRVIERTSELKSAKEELEFQGKLLAEANANAINLLKKTEDKNHELSMLNQKLEKQRILLDKMNARLESEIAEKEDFLRAVSHDLNAPLNNIAGLANSILRKHGAEINEDMRDRLQRIERNIQRESELLGDLLELSRIKSRRLSFENTNIRELVDLVIESLEQQIEQKKIQIQIATPLPIICCERNRFRQVFQNLIDNAIKYMGKQDRPSIELGCEDNNGFYKFWVKDNGVGIKKEDQDKIFFVFRRLKNETTRDIQGKGVGLSTVKRIIETYNGEIWVESQEGRGSTFFFTIPKKASVH
ncbi:MAG: ATP-binding protein [Acidobacteriota bacterium]